MNKYLVKTLKILDFKLFFKNFKYNTELIPSLRTKSMKISVFERFINNRTLISVQLFQKKKFDFEKTFLNLNTKEKTINFS